MKPILPADDDNALGDERLTRRPTAGDFTHDASRDSETVPAIAHATSGC